MPLPITRSYETQATPSYSTSAPSPVLLSQGFPTGDVGIEAIEITYNFANTHGTGATPTTDGQLLAIDSIYLESSAHGPIISNWDGLGAHRFLSYIWGTAPFTTAFAASTGSFPGSLLFPMALPKHSFAVRPVDSILDMANARLSLRVQLTDTSKMLGTPGNDALVTTIQAAGRHMIGVGAAELPTMIPVFSMKKVSYSSSGNVSIPMDYGNLIYLAIGVSPRNSATYAEQAALIADTGTFRLDVNGYDAVAPIMSRELKGMNKLVGGIETLGTGFHVLDFFTDSGLVKRGVDTIGKQGNMNLLIDAVSGTNQQLWVYSWALKPMTPSAARVPEQLAQAR